MKECIPCLRGDDHPWHDNGTWNDEHTTYYGPPPSSVWGGADE